MNWNDRQEWFAIVAFGALCIFIGLCAGVSACSKAWEVDSVKNGKAEYSQSTGEWQWKK